ncbi:MAG TPA: HypC/HybG/HupF family hydrogenase formation chaperone [Gemmatimonadaceae bacterium]|jgi:hydrogenase maturation factor
MKRENETDVVAQCGSDHCITCSDEGVPMRVASLDHTVGLARCLDAADQETEVMIALVPDARVGDTLLVHAATALTRLDTNRTERV